MHLPKPRVDLTVNIPLLLTLVIGILAIGSYREQTITNTRAIGDHEVRIRSLEGQAVVLARIEEQLKTLNDKVDSR